MVPPTSAFPKCDIGVSVMLLIFAKIVDSFVINKPQCFDISCKKLKVHTDLLGYFGNQ